MKAGRKLLLILAAVLLIALALPLAAREARAAEEMDFDTFLYRVHNESLTLSAMAFKDAGNLDLERLRLLAIIMCKHATMNENGSLREGAGA